MILIAVIPITAGSGTNLHTEQRADLSHDQYVRVARATAKGTLPNIPWLVTTAGLANVIGADTTRVGLLLVNAGNGVVYIRFDATIPAPTATPPLYDWLLNPGERWDVPPEWSQLAVSMAGAAAGGYVLGAAGTAA